MIEFVKGKIDSLSPTSVVIATPGGVGYALNIALPVYTELNGKTEAKLLVHESIREDAWTLYGFLTSHERDLFRALIGVSGVGSATASIILSSMPVADLERAISSGDDTALKKVKGIGKKTAERIIVDLKDKVQISSDLAVASAQAVNSESYDEALAALVMLGFLKAPSQKVLKSLFEANPDLKVEMAIKKALSML